MPKILLHTTIQYKRNTYKIGDVVECSVEDVEKISEYGTKIEEEQQNNTKIEKKIKSTRRNAKKVDK